MRFRARRWLGAPMLALFLGFSVAGCSGDQDSEEAVNASDNQAANGDGNAAAGNDNGGGGNATADDGGGGGNAATNAAGADTAAAPAPGGESDLQDIITEMNGQQPAAGAEGDGGKAVAQAAPAQPVPAQPAPAKAPEQAQAPAAPTLPFQPGGTPAAAGLPELGSKMAYIVEKGDTLAKISQKVYGAPSHWQEMAQLSGISNPSRIYPGDLVYYTLDESAVAFAKNYESLQRSEEQVKPGDTLATIAQRLYGTTTAWRTLWRHNDKIDNPDIVAPGTTVYYLPKGALTAAAKIVKHTSVQLADAAKKSTVKNLSKCHLTGASTQHHGVMAQATKATKATKQVRGAEGALIVSNSHAATTIKMLI